MTVEKRAAKVPLAQRPRAPMARGSFVQGACKGRRHPTQSLLVQMYALHEFGRGALPFKVFSLCCCSR
jgi:hypothetical protein